MSVSYGSAIKTILISGGFHQAGEGGEMRSFEDDDDDDDWIPKEPMIKFKDLEDEEGSDREVRKFYLLM